MLTYGGPAVAARSGVWSVGLPAQDLGFRKFEGLGLRPQIMTLSSLELKPRKRQQQQQQEVVSYTSVPHVSISHNDIRVQLLDVRIMKTPVQKHPDARFHNVEEHSCSCKPGMGMGGSLLVYLTPCELAIEFDYQKSLQRKP